MRIFADLHIHSKYSRACSQQLVPTEIAKWCAYKGIKVVGTGDFTHPGWLSELKNSLQAQEPGLYTLKDNPASVRFVFSTELSCIYKQGEACRRIHVCILAPSYETAKRLTTELKNRNFNLASDGRPILGLSVKNLTQLILDLDPKCLIFPAHIWTPWFALLGSKSGFDSLEECFEELTPHIFAIETGLSSDPKMNWQLSMLENTTLLSNSDCHSPANLGRECNVFELDELSYDNIYKVIETNDPKSFLYTIEFFPEEGRYHFDGHAKCNYSCLPEVSRKNNNLCPVCKKPLTLGTMHRINELCDVKQTDNTKRIPYKSLIPLQEIIADYFEVGKNSKKVQTAYLDIVKQATEFEVLIDKDESELNQLTLKGISDLILKVRQGQVDLIPGYDGKYGQIKIKKAPEPKQTTLF